MQSAKNTQDFISNVDKNRGLSDILVDESRHLFGNNVLTPPEKESLWHRFLDKFNDPLIIILLIAWGLSLGISFYEFYGLEKGAGVFFEPLGIFIAIILATGLAFFFEVKADKEFAILNQISDDDAVTVVRNGQPLSIPKKDVVVGDTLLLSQGEEIPADAVLFDTKSMNVDESTLTGEPIALKSSDKALFDTEATFPTSHVMRGTKIMEGHGKGQVIAVGDNTENGRVYQAAQIDNSVKTPLAQQLDRLGRLISNASYIIAGLIIVGKLLLFFNWAALAWLLALPTALLFYLVICKFPNFKGSTCITTLAIFFAVFIGMVILVFKAVAPGESLSELLAYTLQTIMIAVTLIVVAVPEGLPMAITLSLAYSMRRMLKTNNLVRKMHACETMGATTVICTDKTGTLTQNRMQVKDSIFPSQPGGMLHPQASMTALAIAINSTAQVNWQNPKQPVVLGNPTEGALLLWLKSMGFDYEALRESVSIVSEIPFSTERKYMATVVADKSGNRYLFIKGAPEIVMAMCSGNNLSMSDNDINSQLLEWQNHSMRTLAFASKQLASGEHPITDGQISADNIQFDGMVAIADPIRPDVPAAIEECLNAGIAIKIVTGDTPGTAKEIARQIGLWTDMDTNNNIITGPEFGNLTDEELDKIVNSIKIIARARPMDKKRLVESLQRNGQIVAVTGDGTNDAPALKSAHVGLSMGDGTSVAKEASDITIIDNSFSSIGRAVMWGRSLYRNIQRFILFQMTVNVAACLIVLAGAFMGTESPLTVTQMLWVNLIMDTFAAMALASLPPSADVMRSKPRKPSDFIISPQMKRLIVFTGLVFFAILFALVYTFEHSEINSITDLLSVHFGAPDTLSDYELSLIFTTFVFLQFWNIFNARAYATHRSAFHLAKCGEFVFIALLIFFGQIIIVEIGGQFFNVTPLPLRDWIIIIFGTSPVLLVGEALRALHGKKNR
ncbi:MAG: cation-translocating P-type ATPase [Muribaculum sp.]|nr:cation-translocating P-type ATPase [Muribaculaceae bacterium]MCM1081391.1 cation-translocating P-type ATPase [Muribaculum sp.]